jgi:GcrA cell cycle regulator
MTVPPFAWNEMTISFLRYLWDDGGSCSQIAAIMGTSKNAIIGKAHRLKLPMRKTGTPRSERTMEMAKDKATKSPVTMRVAAVAPLPHVLIPVCLVPASFEPNPCTITELSRYRCKWPEGNPASPDFHYCGAAKEPSDKPYCTHHAKIAFSPSRPNGPQPLTGARSFLMRNHA